MSDLTYFPIIVLDLGHHREILPPRLDEGRYVTENSHQGVKRSFAGSFRLEADPSSEARWGSRRAYDELALESEQTAKDPILFDGGARICTDMCSTTL
jgi:hypothetical protein